MRTPHRRADQRPPQKIDPLMTESKYQELKVKLNKWEKINHPREIAEVKRLALMGDFSENDGYQLAKSRLRSLNYRILKLKKIIKIAKIISPDKDNKTVQIGKQVTIKSVNQESLEKKYKILGSLESNPEKHIISHNSPLGKALLSHKSGDIIKLKLKDKIKRYKIIKIE